MLKAAIVSTVDFCIRFAYLTIALALLIGGFAIYDLLQIEWVKWGGFSQVECDSKGFFVNVTVTSSRHVCAHAKIDQDGAPER